MSRLTLRLPADKIALLPAKMVGAYLVIGGDQTTGKPTVLDCASYGEKQRNTIAKRASKLVTRMGGRGIVTVPMEVEEYHVTSMDHDTSDWLLNAMLNDITAEDIYVALKVNADAQSMMPFVVRTQPERNLFSDRVKEEVAKSDRQSPTPAPVKDDASPAPATSDNGKAKPSAKAASKT